MVKNKKLIGKIDNKLVNDQNYKSSNQSKFDEFRENRIEHNNKYSNAKESNSENMIKDADDTRKNKRLQRKANLNNNVSNKNVIKKENSNVLEDILDLKNKIDKIKDIKLLNKCILALQDIVSSVNFKNIKIDDDWKDCIDSGLKTIQDKSKGPQRDWNQGKADVEIIDKKQKLNGKSINVTGELIDSGGSWPINYEYNWCNILTIDNITEFEFDLNELILMFKEMGFNEIKYQYKIFVYLHHLTGDNEHFQEWDLVISEFRKQNKKKGKEIIELDEDHNEDSDDEQEQESEDEQNL